MELFKRFLPRIITLAVICLIAACGYVKQDIVNVGTEVDNTKTVIIDAGHGGFDGGAVAGDGTVEKDINLQISLRVAKFLEYSGYNVILTRDSDSGTEDDETAAIATRKKSDLSNRLSLMKDNPDAIYVSIHLNKFTTSAANGAQVFYTKNYTEARDLAQAVQSNIVELIQPQNTRVIKQGTSSTYLLKNATVPAVIVECGFLSNSAELEKLKSSEYQSQMAFAISGGIINFLEG